MWTRRGVIRLAASALAAVLPRAVGARTRAARTAELLPLDTPEIVGLHLDQLARCGAAGARRANRIGPALLRAARHPPAGRFRRPADAAFALIEESGEFPRLPGRSGGLQ